MTKKRLSALQRIINREVYQIELKKQNNQKLKRVAGLHPSRDRYVVTDGYVALIFCDKPEGVLEAERIDSLYDLVRKNIEDCDHFLALTVTDDHIKEWKHYAKQWKAGKTYKTGAIPVKLSAQTNDGGTVEGFYDPRCLVDAVEAIGDGAMLYIGKCSKNSVFCSLLVFPRDWMENNNHDIMGYVLPIRSI